MASIITEYPRPNHMRPPQGQTTEEGLNPGDPGYVDPHGEAMEEFNQIQGALNEEGGAESFHLGTGKFKQDDPEGANYLGTGKKNRGTGDRARLAANQTAGQTASLLTG